MWVRAHLVLLWVRNVAEATESQRVVLAGSETGVGFEVTDHVCLIGITSFEGEEGEAKGLAARLLQPRKGRLETADAGEGFRVDADFSLEEMVETTAAEACFLRYHSDTGVIRVSHELVGGPCNGRMQRATSALAKQGI